MGRRGEQKITGWTRGLCGLMAAVVLLMLTGCQGPRAFDAVSLDDPRELRRESRVLWAADDWPGLNPDAARLIVLDVQVDLSDRADDGRLVRWPFDAEEIVREHFREALAESLKSQAMVDVERSPEAAQPVVTGDSLLILDDDDHMDSGAEDREVGARTLGHFGDAGALGFGESENWNVEQVAVLCRQLDADAAVRVKIRVKVDGTGRLVIRPASTFDVAAGFYSDPLRPDDPIMPRREGQLSLRGGLRTIDSVAKLQPAWLDTLEPIYGDENRRSRWITDAESLSEEAKRVLEPLTRTVVFRLKG